MLEIAVVKIGLSPSEFWDLSWYEWGLYLLRVKHQQERDKQISEERWHQTRIIWSTIRNVNGIKTKPTELIKLSFDGLTEKEKPKPGEVVNRFKEKLNAGRTK